MRSRLFASEPLILVVWNPLGDFLVCLALTHSWSPRWGISNVAENGSNFWPTWGQAFTGKSTAASGVLLFLFPWHLWLLVFCCGFKPIYRVLGSSCELLLCGLFWTSCVHQPVAAEGWKWQLQWLLDFCFWHPWSAFAVLLEFSWAGMTLILCIDLYFSCPLLLAIINEHRGEKNQNKPSYIKMQKATAALRGVGSFGTPDFSVREWGGHLNPCQRS